MRNRIIEVQNGMGIHFRVGQVVGHQDKSVGTATIIGFDMSDTHPYEIKATTDRGKTAHIDFLEPLPGAADAEL